MTREKIRFFVGCCLAAVFIGSAIPSNWWPFVIIAAAASLPYGGAVLIGKVISQLFPDD